MMGRPEHKPTPETRQLVEALSGFGVPYKQIGALIDDGIDRETLAKHYEKEIQSGKAKAASKIGQTLFQKAMAGDTTALIWWTKAQMRWKGTDVYETPDMRHRESDPRELSDEEILDEIRKVRGLAEEE